MRRSVIEWLSITSVGLFVVTVAVLIASFHPAWPASPLQIAKDRWDRSIAFVQIRAGNASLFNEIDFDSVDSPKPWVVVPRTVIAPRVVSNRQFAIPGIAFQYCRFAGGSPVWSLSVSLAIPAAILLIAAILCIRKFRRGRPQATLSHVKTAF